MLVRFVPAQLRRSSGTCCTIGGILSIVMPRISSHVYWVRPQCPAFTDAALLASFRRLFQIRRIYHHSNSLSCHRETASPYAVKERSPCYQPRPTLPSSAGSLAYRGLRAPADINSYQRSYTMGSSPTACGGSNPPDNPWAPIQLRLLQVPSPSGWRSPLRPPPSPTPCRRFPLTR